ncbi:MAG: DUF2871 domain-containing protein [Candidatus Saccharibacteria bacterium]|nr:DUF2871 domain-containing protein [Candidatus Saccharibacteria bacterium]
MKRLYYTSLTYLVIGLSAGVVYREATRWMDFTGTTKLSLLHVHTLTLGMLFFLIVLLLEKQWRLSRSRWFHKFFWLYNSGLLLTLSIMAYIGTQQLAGPYQPTGMIAGMSGIGHILLAAGLGCFFASLGERLRK